jgi:hypothetical protein
MLITGVLGAEPRLRSTELVGWVELFAKPITAPAKHDGYRFRLRSLSYGGQVAPPILRAETVGTLRFAHPAKPFDRHCEERSDEAIQLAVPPWIASPPRKQKWRVRFPPTLLELRRTSR